MYLPFTQNVVSFKHYMAEAVRMVSCRLLVCGFKSLPSLKGVNHSFTLLPSEVIHMVSTEKSLALWHVETDWRMVMFLIKSYSSQQAQLILTGFSFWSYVWNKFSYFLSQKISSPVQYKSHLNHPVTHIYVWCNKQLYHLEPHNYLLSVWSVYTFQLCLPRC